MSPFQYASASTPDEAMSLIGKNGRYLGGGIDLIDEMKQYIVEPDVLVNVNGIQRGTDTALMSNPVLLAYAKEFEIATTVGSYSEPNPEIAPICLVLGSALTISVLTENQNIKSRLPAWPRRLPKLVLPKFGM